MTDLKSLLVESRTTEVEYPGLPGFVLELAFLSREATLKLRKECLKTVYDKKLKAPVEEFDSEEFSKKYITAIVKGWKGLTYTYLNDLALVDISTIEDPETEVPYSPNNAFELMKSSSDLDEFVSEVTSNLASFTKYSSKL